MTKRKTQEQNRKDRGGEIICELEDRAIESDQSE